MIYKMVIIKVHKFKPYHLLDAMFRGDQNFFFADINRITKKLIVNTVIFLIVFLQIGESFLAYFSQLTVYFCLYSKSCAFSITFLSPSDTRLNNTKFHLSQHRYKKKVIIFILYCRVHNKILWWRIVVIKFNQNLFRAHTGIYTIGWAFFKLKIYGIFL